MTARENGRPETDPSDALVPEGGIYEGQVAVIGETRIDGFVGGSLRGEGRLSVGPKARIEGRVECGELDSAGRIEGPVRVARQARLSAGAQFDGDLTAPRLEVDDEAIWNGRARVGLPPTSDD